MIESIMLTTINPDYKKITMPYTPIAFQDDYNEQTYDVVRTFISDGNNIYGNKHDVLKLLNEFYISPDNELKISKDVYTNAFDIINLLPETFIETLDDGHIFPSNYGTIVIEIESKDYYLIIDIGEKQFGYYLEKDESIKQKDSANISDKIEINTLVKYTADLV